MSFFSIVKSYLSCKHYTEMCCKSRDQNLTTFEKSKYYFHHILCFTCRRFSRQVEMIDKVCERLVDCDSSESTKLSEEAKSKISEVLVSEVEK